MRVLHVLHTSLPVLCGYSIRSDYILRSQADQGLEVAVVTSAQHAAGADARDEVNGVTHWRTASLTGRQAPVLREARLMRALRGRVNAALREWKPDLIHAHSPMLVGLPALRAARHAGLPFVYEIRDLWENASVDRGKFTQRSARYRIARFLETYVVRNADAVVAICEALRAEIAARTPRPERVFVVANGVDASQFAPRRDGADARARWGLDGKAVIGYVGTFQPYEGLDLLIRAMPQILARAPAAHLVITGAGGEEERLRRLASDSKLAEHVTLTGRVPHEEVGAVYAMANVMAYPRILTRTTALTTPLKPLEAMAMQKAVIVSDVPAMREIVQPGCNGLSFRAGNLEDLAATCADLLNAPDLQAELGTRARQWVLDERQWPSLVARYEQVYATAGAR